MKSLSHRRWEKFAAKKNLEASSNRITERRHECYVYCLGGLTGCEFTTFKAQPLIVLCEDGSLFTYTSGL